MRRFADSVRASAVLLIEHDVASSCSAVCDRIVVVDFGRKIAEGNPAEIRTIAPSLPRTWVKKYRPVTRCRWSAS